MKTLVLLDKFYCYGMDFDEKYLSRALIQLIKERNNDFDIKIEYVGLHQPGNRPIIAIAGKEENIVYNNIIKEFGTIYEFSNVNVGDILRGRMRNPDNVNFGIFFDCGIENPEKDVLYPVFAMKNQLVDGNKIPKKKICKAYGFFEEMPVYLKITKIDEKNKKIECELTEQTINMIKSWIEDGFEILFSTGMPRKQIKRAVKKTKHYPDYITIERIGFLETMVFLKSGTHAPGILSEIGPLLSNVRFSMLRPSIVKHLKGL